MSNKSTIVCPSCHSKISIEEALYAQLESKFDADTQEQRLKYKKAVTDLKLKEESFKKQEEHFDDTLQDALQLQLKAKEQALRESLTKEITQSQSQAQLLLQEELDTKSKQLQEFNKTKAELESVKREKNEQASAIKASLEEKASKNLDEALAKANKDAREQRVKLQEEFNKNLSQKLESEKVLMKRTIEDSLRVENNKEIQKMQTLLETKSEEVKELESSKAEIAKLKMEKSESEAKVKSELQIEFYETLSQEKQKAIEEVTSQNDLKLKEKDEQLAQIKRKLEDTQRQVSQGSMQIQGEVQEHAIEDWLRTQFKFDTIDEIGKGAYGADCIETVNTRELQNCGKICYESKNTKEWSNNWIPKLKQDMLRANADIGVLVTQAMPKDIDRMGFIEGIWVCNLDEFKGSCALLRNSLIELKRNSQFQENKTDKMSILYSYLSSNEFNMQMTSIVDGFTLMQTELDKQKKSNMASWKRQQRHIDSVLINTTEMYGSIKGIAGKAIANVQALELEYDDTEEV
ncbi:MAG: DUF2130 domain-containing protein [Sulfurimonas sp.]|nr:DUF2130 domain-containing protein [Sulfurimonas sp.]